MGGSFPPPAPMHLARVAAVPAAAPPHRKCLVRDDFVALRPLAGRARLAPEI